MKFTHKLFQKTASNPSKILVAGFLMLILLGSILLRLPSFHQGGSVSYIDALFTSTSAICVTGLTTIPTVTWTGAGKVFLILLIQIGGWGVMTIATLIFMALGRTVTLNNRIAIQAQFNEDGLSGMVRLIRYIIFSSLSIEIIGAFLLSLRFIPLMGMTKGIAYGISHAISAYCNAGFDLLGDSFLSFQQDPFVLLVLSILIILGGLGFSVYYALTVDYKNKTRLNLHTKVVLMTTGILLVTGTIFFYFLERNNVNTLGHLPLRFQWLNAFFQSVTLRTARFFSIPQEHLGHPASMLGMLFMFIGGSPAGTAGGIKTTTFAVLVLSMIAEVRGKNDVEMFHRRVDLSTMRQSLSIFIIGMLWIFIVVFLMMLTEKADPGMIFYEVFSAFGTVGVSKGLTVQLSLFGKLILCATMFLGRVGPLTLGYAIAKNKSKPPYRELKGNIMIG